MTQTDIDGEIKSNKELRRDITALLDRLSKLPGSRERSLVRTKLDEASMWLGKDLQRIGELPPCCPCCHSNIRVTKSPAESAERGEWFCPCNEAPPEYTQTSGHFNAASAVPNPYPDSKRPENTIINPPAPEIVPPVNSEKRTYLVHSATGYFPIDATEDTVIQLARKDPKSLRVVDSKTGRLVWLSTNP